MKSSITAMVFTLIFLLHSQEGAAQINTTQIAKAHIESNRAAWNLNPEDVAELQLYYEYQSTHNGLHHLYFIQQYKGTPVKNAVLNFSIMADGKILSVGNRCVGQLASKATVTNPSVTAITALQTAMTELNIPANTPTLKERRSERELIFDKGDFSLEDVLVKLYFQLSEDQLQLVWDFDLYDIKRNDLWNFQIDAVSGKITSKISQAYSCQFNGKHHQHHTDHCHSNTTETSSALPVLPDSYRVYALPTESPAHGNRTTVTDPADLMASPFGWHDTDGVAGAEYTITRGNNIHAFQDRDGNFSSSEDEPDGGPTLDFNFPFVMSNEPAQNQDAAVTNLFYTCNAVHDFAYHYGLDEAAGAYQINNYGNLGAGNDPITGLAQYGANASSNVNNARFFVTPDGVTGRLQMFVWNSEAGGGQKLLQINSPSSIAGTYSAGIAEFGPPVSSTPINGEIVIVQDDTFNPYPTDGCENITNGAELVGKIALVDRGGCSFKRKTKNAEDEGAIAVIMCNFEETNNPMGDVDYIATPSIPIINLKFNDCQIIRAQIESGVNATIVLPAVSTPQQLDGDFDNGTIVHEYGHGISSRLAGGPINEDCLQGGELFRAEGWSDFFALATTAKAGDTGAMPRGIATYLYREANTGKGIRRYPYSTDMTINPHTYADIINNPSSEHFIGEVWASILWDLYWALVDKYNFDPNLYTGTGGNNIAIALVMDALTIQPCTPGFIDARNAILSADQLNNGGANQTLIWQVFANRGVGFSADQGSNLTAADQLEAFDLPPQFITELKIKKSMSPLVQAGDNITVELTVTNHKILTVSNLKITDELPAGLSYVAGSATNGGTQVGSEMVFDAGSLNTGESITVSYQAKTDADLYSIEQFYDDIEGNEDNWATEGIQNTNLFSISTGTANSGTKAWKVENVNDRSHQVLVLSNTKFIQGTQPAFRFYHQYNTEPGTDGGIVEISTDGGTTWADLRPHIFRQSYTGPIQYNTFVQPDLYAFWGNSQGFVPTYIDMSPFLGEVVTIRFRFGTNDAVSADAWYIDDVEFLDLYNYEGEACVSSEQGDQVCAIAPRRGTIVESQISTSVNDLLADQTVQLQLQPNPADALIQVSIASEQSLTGTLSIYSMNGKQFLQQRVSHPAGKTTIPMDTTPLSAGIYFVKLTTAKGSLIKKLVIQ